MNENYIVADFERVANFHANLKSADNYFGPGLFEIFQTYVIPSSIEAFRNDSYAVLHLKG